MSYDDYPEILKVLGQRRFPVWHPVMEGGKPLLDQLLKDLDVSPSPLSERQSLNAMLVLMRLRQWGDTQELIRVLGKYISSPSIQLRSEAAKYLAGFITLSRDSSHKREKIAIAEIPPLLKRAKTLGLKKQVSDLVDHLI
jgi:hypothetical protein